MWTMIRNAEEWAAYCKATAARLMITSEQVAWGDGPKVFPCLVSTLLPPRPAGAPAKLVSAYVYPADAEELLKAAGRKFLEPDQPVPPNQKQFNRWATAMIMAMVKNDIKTGLFAPMGGEDANKSAFESRLLEEIELVDQYHGAEKERLRKSMASYETTVLDTLEPPR